MIMLHAALYRSSLPFSSCGAGVACFSWPFFLNDFSFSSSNSNFELVFVSRIPQIRLKKSVTEILLRRFCDRNLLRRSCYGDSVTETPTHFNPYRFRQTLSTTHRRLIPCKGYLNTHPSTGATATPSTRRKRRSRSADESKNIIRTKKKKHHQIQTKTTNQEA